MLIWSFLEKQLPFTDIKKQLSFIKDPSFMFFDC